MRISRETSRERVMAEIREHAWRQMEQSGAAGLSLRAIARELGVVSSAIYRYVASRDELLTDLLLDGHRDLARAVDAAEGCVPVDAYRERWLTICRTMRSWALSRPAAWTLVYGGSVPGYSEPFETTTPVASRLILRYGEVVLSARAAGQLRPRVGPAAGLGTLSEDARSGLAALAAEYGVDAEAELVALGLLCWSGVIGTINAEMFMYLGPEPVAAQGAMAEALFASLADAVGL